MIPTRTVPTMSAAAIFAMICWLPSIAKCDDTKAANPTNPKYIAWARFKPGSSNTIAADMESHGNKMHLEVTRTLISVADDEVVIETKSVVTVMGHDHAYPANKQTFKAKGDKDQIKPTGKKNVDAMGKTFTCRVFEATAKPDAVVDKKEVPGTNIEGKKATVYASEDVPGGIVKLETVGNDGSTPVTFVLIAMEIK